MLDTEVRDCIVGDGGPVANALIILATETTLREHVTVERGRYTTTVNIDSDIPFAVWGSGTQALWRLASSMAYSGETVSLYATLSRLDRLNTVAVFRAFSALCGGAA